MKTRLALSLSIVLAVIAAAYHIAIATRLPETMPARWSPGGEVTAVAPVWLFTVLNFGVIIFAMVQMVLGHIGHRKGWRWIRWRESANAILLGVVALVSGMHIYLLNATLTGADPGALLVGAVMLVIALLGNYLAKSQPVSEHVPDDVNEHRRDWINRRSTRLAGRVMFGAGIAGMVVALAGYPDGAFPFAVIAILAPLVYRVVVTRSVQQVG
jgi:MFS family permease